MDNTPKEYINPKEELRKVRRKSAKMLMYLGIISITMLFAGFTSAYVVRMQKGNWLVFELPPTTYLSTAIIILSSMTYFFAQRAIRLNKHKFSAGMIFITFLLGLGFTWSQFTVWKELTEQGIFFLGKYANVSGSFFYIIALMHLLHLFGGLIALFYTGLKAWKKKYSASDFLGISLTGIYWHFLTLLWVYLFLFLYNFR
ncbi:MAG: cytochrome c oxidase subunit 3 [Bacteroidia bacterium]|nr:cytochrome c oxidase subunit 3 [Bacteroidia bacterium]